MEKAWLASECVLKWPPGHSTGTRCAIIQDVTNATYDKLLLTILIFPSADIRKMQFNEWKLTTPEYNNVHLVCRLWISHFFSNWNFGDTLLRPTLDNVSVFALKLTVQVANLFIHSAMCPWPEGEVEMGSFINKTFQSISACLYQSGWGTHNCKFWEGHWTRRRKSLWDVTLRTWNKWLKFKNSHIPQSERNSKWNSETNLLGSMRDLLWKEAFGCI